MGKIMADKIITKVNMYDNFFTEGGLNGMTGMPPSGYDFVIIKEILDNALDAIESKDEKNIELIADENSIKIFDNGPGLSKNLIEDMYDYSSLTSKNRVFKAPSRGQQGMGLKSVIGICFIKGYTIRWHTKEGIYDAFLNVTLDNIDIQLNYVGETQHKGIEIIGYREQNSKFYRNIINSYRYVNRDILFHTIIYGEDKKLLPTVETNEKGNKTNIMFYKEFSDFRRLVEIYAKEFPDITYKQFIIQIFNTQLSNVKPSYRGKLRNIVWEKDSRLIEENFNAMKRKQPKKAGTILKQSLAWTKQKDPVLIMYGKDGFGNNVPILVEIEVTKIPEQYYKKGSLHCRVFINNTLSYHDEESVQFKRGKYKIDSKKPEYASNLYHLLRKNDEYQFIFHFVSSGLEYKDPGKTKFDITPYMDEFCHELQKKISKEHKKYLLENGTKKTNRSIMREKMDEAYYMTSTNGKYNITVRQLYYKVRELAGATEKDLNYNDFSQTIATEWLNKHPELKTRVHFSDRGVFYLRDERLGIGTGTFLEFEENQQWSKNTLTIQGNANVSGDFIKDFQIKYDYDKALYIEKTGFDGLFNAEGVDSKYHMAVISGQGFATRSAKEILSICQDQGLTLYCLHDLDIYGINIFNSLQESNDKFQGQLKVIDLGITIEDINYYNITPETLDAPTKKEKEALKKMDKKLAEFFYHDGKLHRAELSALSTEQILDLLNRKLQENDNRPKLDVADTVKIDKSGLVNIALIQLIKEKYGHIINNIHYEFDIEKYRKKVNYDELLFEANIIQKDIIEELKELLQKELKL